MIPHPTLTLGVGLSCEHNSIANNLGDEIGGTSLRPNEIPYNLLSLVKTPISGVRGVSGGGESLKCGGRGSGGS